MLLDNTLISMEEPLTCLELCMDLLHVLHVLHVGSQPVALQWLEVLLPVGGKCRHFG